MMGTEDLMTDEEFEQAYGPRGWREALAAGLLVAAVLLAPAVMAMVTR